MGNTDLYAEKDYEFMGGNPFEAMDSSMVRLTLRVLFACM